jgi:hypothetical protein
LFHLSLERWRNRGERYSGRAHCLKIKEKF